MFYLADFARPKGSKDKQKRRPRTNAEKLATGALIGAGIGAVDTKLNHHNRVKLLNNIYSDKIYDELLAKEGLTRRKVMKQGLMRSVPLNALIGLGGSALAIKIKKDIQGKK